MTLESQIRNIQAQVSNLKTEGDSIKSTVEPTFPVITKFAFRELLTQLQETVWDNYDILKDTLGLTNDQFMAIRTFRARFDSAEKVTLTDAYLVQGLSALASWNLTLNEQPVFTQAEADRILAGQPFIEAE